MRKLRMGMVGGGPGAFIGEVHRLATQLDGRIELVAGNFSRNQAGNRKMGQELGLAPDRIYPDYREMIRCEAILQPEQRIDFVSIVTPNHLHFPISKEFLEAGFNVMCEKPMTLSLEQAKELHRVVTASGKTFALMHNYSGYPMVKLARDLVRQGDLGTIRKVVVIFPQGWLAQPIEKQDNKQASWRTDPLQSGAGGCIGDIGTHAENLAEYITGLKITALCADLTAFVQGRQLDDDGNILLQFDSGAKGVLHCSQISINEENGLAIWLYGSKGGLEWHQEHPNQLYFKPLNAPVQIWSRGNGYVAAKSAAAGRATRLPAGHPEAFIEAFANNYRNFVDTILIREQGIIPDELINDFPQIEDGIRSMAFIETAVESAGSREKWHVYPEC